MICVFSQGDCCSSYAISAVGAVEGAQALASGKMKPMSVQNIVDCSGALQILQLLLKPMLYPLLQEPTATMAAPEVKLRLP